MAYCWPQGCVDIIWSPSCHGSWSHFLPRNLTFVLSSSQPVDSCQSVAQPMTKTSALSLVFSAISDGNCSAPSSIYTPACSCTVPSSSSPSPSPSPPLDAFPLPHPTGHICMSSIAFANLHFSSFDLYVLAGLCCVCDKDMNIGQNRVEED